MSLARSNRQLEIIELAEAVANDFWSGDSLDPERVFRENGIGFAYGNYGDSFDGMLEFENGQFFVFINRDRDNHPGSARARFTAGHEIGHYFIDEHRRLIRDGAGQHPSISGLFDASEFDEEHEADVFSANLLMPPSRFSRRLVDRVSPLTQIQQLAPLFNTSLTSTAIQFIALSSIPAAIITWNSEGDFRWMKLSDEFRQDDRRKYWAATKYAKPEGIPPDSATGTVLRGDASESQCATTASHVFLNVQSGGYRDDILLEECFRLGRYGFITLLSPHASA